MKYISLFLLIIFFSCKRNENNVAPVVVKKTEKTKNIGFDYADFYVVNDTVANGDTFAGILENQKLEKKYVQEIILQIKNKFNVNSITEETPYTLLKTKTKDHKLQILIYEQSQSNYFVFDFRKNPVTVERKQKPVKIKQRVVSGVLKGGLYETFKTSNIDEALAPKIAKIYGWSIDFFKLKKGDRFGLIINERYINDSIYDGVENLEAGFVEYKGKVIYAFPFIQDTLLGKIDYYDEQGKTLRNFFLRSPIKFTHISSHFSLNRFHPVKHIWKSHKGTDYAAPSGTPIIATASGSVEQIGFTTGNGNFVKIKHNKTYSTQYLHMSRILVKPKQNVNQGQIIGLVGSTGLATGSHVCYRFWKDGEQVNHLKLNLPAGEPMSVENRSRFWTYMLPLKNKLDSISNL